jgi:hypothetical protein
MKAGYHRCLAPSLGSLCLLLMTWAAEAFHAHGFIPAQADVTHWKQPCTSFCGWQPLESLALRPYDMKAHSTIYSSARRGRTGTLGSLRASFATSAIGPANLLARVAEVGLKLKLRSHDLVQVNIDSSPTELLQGSVQGVTVRGKLWSSPLLLTCRSLEATVGETAVVWDALARGQIEMKKPAIGTCNVVFNGGANFLLVIYRASMPSCVFVCAWILQKIPGITGL